ncbi:TetR/AcrR family transcriptional regulator [Paeniglutamicibacter kerguelensis]|uniref:AcrR family transcriptional regulator n=1 Tax=Paeniglutamicibacter kerguelensis TaxID=254788 RepID=A0ABS4XGK7_9MICC|nr:TetR family transcriptional regulator [Paeniglutamicibacter kerguelensis]MBP2387606.1 AcrR family transcriptional regulator [Paeniglutamicibacter kerguelensis]
MRTEREDFTTRSKIRDAAIVLFGRQGFAHTTIRDIAAAAQVSPGLVIHHFASKAGLREACDRHILGISSQRAVEKADVGSLQKMMSEYLSKPDTYMAETAYIRQAIMDDSALGDAFFDALVAMTVDMLEAGIANGSIRQLEDLRATAVVLATNSMGMLVLGRHVARSLGQEEFGVDTVNLIGVPVVDLYTHPLYADERFLTAARAAIQTTAKTEEH